MSREFLQFASDPRNGFVFRARGNVGVKVACHVNDDAFRVSGNGNDMIDIHGAAGVNGIEIVVFAKLAHDPFELRGTVAGMIAAKIVGMPVCHAERNNHIPTSKDGGNVLRID